MSRRLVLPLVVILLACAGLLGVAAWNRGAAPQSVTLTERELRLPWSWQRPDEGVEEVLRLDVQWQRPEGPLEERAWLTEARLADIGFNLSTPVGAPEAERTYQRAPPRIGWVVLEYDGPAWRRVERRLALRSDDGVAPPGTSRLVPVDAGADRDALARRHDGQTTLILPAVFALGWRPPANGGPLVYGFVKELVVGEVTVPTRLRAPLEALRRAAAAPDSGATAGSQPRFEVDVSVGRLGWPWVTAVRPIE